MEASPVKEMEIAQGLQFLSTAMHCQRLDRKSITHILQFHVNIEEEYRATQRDEGKN